jgi:aspartate ammonia-lyase
MTVSTICHELRLLAIGPQPGHAEIILPPEQAGVVEHDLLTFADHDVMMRDLLESVWWMTGAIVTLRVNCIEGIAANAARVNAFLSSNRLTRQ